MANEPREFRYVGPEHQLSPMKRDGTAPLNAQNAISVIRSAWGEGRVYVSSHFKSRCSERGIDMLDIENVIRNGVVEGKPAFCEINKNWKYNVVGPADERILEVLIALDPTVDYMSAPLAILITAYEKSATGQ